MHEPKRPSDTPADVTRDPTRDVLIATCSWSASSCAVTVRVLLREPGLCKRGGGRTGGAASVVLRLRAPVRRRSDSERERIRFRAVSPSDSVSDDAGEGESSSISRSSSVQVCWPAAATRESGLGAAESDVRGKVCDVGDTVVERRELISMSLSLPLEDESSSVPSPTWRELAELALSLGAREDVDTEGRRKDVGPRGRFWRNAVFEGRRENRD